MTVLYVAVLATLACLALSRLRIYVLCGFYLVYGVLKVMALDESVTLSWSQLLLFRALYPILFISAAVRLFQDRNFMLQIKRVPWLAYFALIVLFLCSAIYSRSAHAFLSGDPANLWAQLTILLLFPLAIAHIQQSEDLKRFAATTVVVSITLSTWIIGNTIALNFQAFRGGIEVNQNFVSLFVLAGTIPLVYVIASAGKKLRRAGALFLLFFILFAAILLASRGIIVAFVFSLFFLAQNRRARTALVFSGAVAIIALALMPQTAEVVQRFKDSDVGTLNGRALVWSYSLREIESSPVHLAIGYGYNSARVILPPVLTDDLWNYHNDSLNWFMDAGILGLAAFLAFLWAMLRRVLHAQSPLRPIILSWFAFLVFSGLSGVISVMHIFWLIMGTICGATSLLPEASQSAGQKNLLVQSLP